MTRPAKYGETQLDLARGLVVSSLIIPLSWASRPASAGRYPVSSFESLQGVIVRDICQDAHGFVWLATDTGLRRWSNEGFRTLEVGSPAGVAARCLLECEHQSMWVGTSDGLVGIDSESLLIRPAIRTLPGLQINDLIRGPSGTIWAATIRGLYELTESAGADGGIGHRRIDGTELLSIQSLLLDSDGSIWIGAGGAILRWDDPDSGDAPRLTQQLGDLVGDRTAQILYRASDGALWIGLRHDGGLYRATQGGVRRFTREDGLLDEAVNDIVEDREGGVWVATENGVYWYRDGRFTPLGYDERLPNGDVHSLLVDRESQIWMGSYGGGAFRLRSPHVRIFGLGDGLPHPTVTSLAVDLDGSLVLGTISGGARFDTRTLTGRAILQNEHVEFAHVTTKGEVWLIGPRGIVIDGEASPLKLGRVTSIASDSAGRVFLGTHGGQIFSVDGNTATRLAPPTERSDPIRALAFLPDGSLCAGDASGLHRWVNESWTVPLSGRDVRALLPAEDGRIWIGTADGVLVGSDGHFEPVGPIELNTGDVRALARGPDGSIWAAVGDCILRWRGGTLQRLTHADGLPSRDVRCLVFDDRGTLFAGTTQGLAAIDAERFHPSDAAPLVAIRRLVAGGRERPTNQDGLELSYADGDVLVQAYSLGWRSSKGIRYQFRIGGQDAAWSKPTTQSAASYTDVAPGEYTVQVRALSADGLLSENVAGITFSVLPPWWSQLSSVLLVLCVTSLVVVLGLAVFARLFPVGGGTVFAIIMISLLGGVIAGVLDANEWIHGNTRSLESWEVDDIILFTPFFLAVGLVWALSRSARSAKRELAQRRRIEESLRLTQFTVDNAAEAIFWIDRNERITLANRAACSSLGYSEDELLTMGVQDIDVIYGTDRWPRDWDIVRDKCATIESRHRRKDGHVFPVEVTLNYMEYSESSFVCAVARDITKRRRAEDEARLHQEELIHVARLSTMGEMASGLAHEINQPLSAIVNYANGCLRRLDAGAVTTPQLVAAIEQISAQATRAGEIIRRLRAFVRKDKPKRNEIDVNDVVNEVAAFVEAEASRAEVNVRLCLSDRPARVLADAVQIEQVILNLFRNAVESVSAGDGRPRDLVIETSSANDSTVAVAVHDKGAALSPEAIQRAFEPFYTTKPHGMGMGLAISRSIVEAHGGTLDASPNANGGMSVSFTLPACKGASRR